MTAKFFALLTHIGAAKLANATALGTRLEITHMAVGDGGGTLPTPNPAQIKLVNEQRRAALNMLTVDPVNTSQIIAEQVIPETEGGWWIREIGLLDKDGDLIAIANCAETYKPQLQEGSGRTQTIRVILIVSSTAAVTLKIDPSVVLATRKYVDDRVIEVKAYADDLMVKHLDAPNPHSQYAPLASPALTGKPTAPTPAAGDNTKQLANTAFIQAAINALGLGSAAKLNSGVAGGVALFNDTLRVVNDLIEIKNKGEIAKTNARINLGCGTAAAKDVGTGAGQIPDMNSFTSGARWVKYPDGTIIQRGRANSSDAGYVLVEFPIPFAVGFTLALLPVSSANPPATRYSANMGPLGDGRTNFSFAVWVLNSNTISSVGTDYIAIGK
ncbi:phage tail protein [Yersinia aleksiciae]|uniref:phage tail protein n=2 Tax=Yersinia aleksiciae TaxID=263819 RepID=UPI0025AA6A7E|nr:phage tail protein [Yersinia aleksiciae]MDN0122151.1 phage tail protein [Yersinia aleksiciae]